MTFRTELSVAPPATPLPPGARILTVGSCFAAVLGKQLRAARLPVLENPFGTILNPVAACRLLTVACGADDYDLSDRAVERDGRWFSYDVPSGLSGATPEELHAVVEAKLAEVRDFVRTADALVLTMGTAWAWRLDDEVVANCHKQPGSIFRKTLLSVQEIVVSFAEMHSWLLRLNPNLRVVLTVSPVRHRKETLEGSSVSKSTLRLACHHLAGMIREVAYFPAYELLLDDLRDYRFFAADMLHPSPLAEEYIFGKFVGAWFDGEFADARLAWAEIDRALAHRSANPTGEAHQQFLLATLDKLDALAAQGFATDSENAALVAQLVGARPKRVAVPAPAATAPRRDSIAAIPASSSITPISPTTGASIPSGPPPSTREIRPIKPIIRVALPPRTVTPAEPTTTEPQVPAPASAEISSPDAAAPTDERREGRRGSRRGRGGRDRRDRHDAPLPVEATLAEEPTDESATEAGTSANAAENLDATAGSAAKKRRGRRGGRRHKQRRDGETAFVPSGDENEYSDVDDSFAELADELQAGAEAAAEIALNDEPTEQADTTDFEPTPAEEVALETTLETPSTATSPNAPPRKSERNGERGGRGRTAGAGGAKKLTLQKVKSPEEATPATQPNTAQPRTPQRSGSKQKGVVAGAAETGTSRPVKVLRQPTAAPTDAPVENATFEPVAVEVTAVAPPARTLPTPVAAPQTPAQPRAPRTPGRAKAQGPVATPVERATAARAVKKAGVGALLSALGGAAAGVGKAAVMPAVVPVVVPPAAAAPVAAPEVSPAKPARKAPATPATPKKSTAKTPAKATAKPVAPPPSVAAAPEVAAPAPDAAAAKPKRPAKPRTPKVK